jgi:hypothetical protein
MARKKEVLLLLEQERQGSIKMSTLLDALKKQGYEPVGPGPLSDSFIHKSMKPPKLPIVDTRVIHVLMMKVFVVAEKNQKEAAMETLSNYIRDWIPDEAPEDPIHILDYEVMRSHCIDANSKRLADFKKSREEDGS